MIKKFAFYINQSIKSLLEIEIIRFLLAGLVNTFGSYITYCFFLLFLNYLISYIITMILFIMLSSYLNTSFVFKLRPSRINLISFFILIFIQVIVGSFVLIFAVKILLIPEILAPLLNIFFITPMKYISSRFLKKTFE